MYEVVLYNAGGFHACPEDVLCCRNVPPVTNSVQTVEIARGGEGERGGGGEGGWEGGGGRGGGGEGGGGEEREGGRGGGGRERELNIR